MPGTLLMTLLLTERPSSKRSPASFRGMEQQKTLGRASGSALANRLAPACLFLRLELRMPNCRTRYDGTSLGIRESSCSLSAN